MLKAIIVMRNGFCVFVAFKRLFIPDCRVFFGGDDLQNLGPCSFFWDMEGGTSVFILLLKIFYFNLYFCFLFFSAPLLVSLTILRRSFGFLFAPYQKKPYFDANSDDCPFVINSDGSQSVVNSDGSQSIINNDRITKFIVTSLNILATIFLLLATTVFRRWRRQHMNFVIKFSNATFFDVFFLIANFVTN